MANADHSGTTSHSDSVPKSSARPSCSRTRASAARPTATRALRSCGSRTARVPGALARSAPSSSRVSGQVGAGRRRGADGADGAAGRRRGRRGAEAGQPRHEVHRPGRLGRLDGRSRVRAERRWRRGGAAAAWSPGRPAGCTTGISAVLGCAGPAGSPGDCGWVGELTAPPCALRWSAGRTSFVRNGIRDRVPGAARLPEGGSPGAGVAPARPDLLPRPAADLGSPAWARAPASSSPGPRSSPGGCPTATAPGWPSSCASSGSTSGTSSSWATGPTTCGTRCRSSRAPASPWSSPPAGSARPPTT